MGISGSSLHFLNWCSKFFFEKRTHNTFQIRQWRQHQETTKFFKNKSKNCRLPYYKDCIVLFRFIFWRNKIHFGKISPIFLLTRTQTNSIRKRVWIVYYNFSAFVICQRSCRISVLCGLLKIIQHIGSIETVLVHVLLKYKILNIYFKQTGKISAKLSNVIRKCMEHQL